MRGQQEVEAGGGALSTRASTREVEDGGAPGGLANSAMPVGWAGHLGRQVGFTGERHVSSLLSAFIYHFLFSATL